jgi:hypothetical protein
MSDSASPTKKIGKQQHKMLVAPMTNFRKEEVVAQLIDDVLSKLASAFFEVVQKEGWGKRDLSLISGMNETAIGHILAGRRKNLTIETVALLTRAMRKRPELLLHDLRPTGNNLANLIGSANADSAATALLEDQINQPNQNTVADLTKAGGPKKNGPSIKELEAVS